MLGDSDIIFLGASTTTGVTTGLETTGFETAKLDTTGLETSGLDTTGLETSGLDTTGLETAELDTTGFKTAEFELTFALGVAVGELVLFDVFLLDNLFFVESFFIFFLKKYSNPQTLKTIIIITKMKFSLVIIIKYILNF
jgi:hypothetical protein